MDKYAERDITRLRNLLREYRNHVITNKYNKLKQSPYKMEITDVIEAVDESIEILIKGL